MHSVYDVLDEMLNRNELAVLATVIDVKGSAYRKEGASMLFFDNGEQVGTISAGCLETDLAIRAKQLLETSDQTSCSVVYDMSAEDDLSWGRGAGCNGVIHVLLERLTASLLAVYEQVKEQLDKDVSIKLIKYLHDEHTLIDTHCFPLDDTNPTEHKVLMKDPPIEEVNGHLYIQGESQTDPSIFIQTFTPKRRLFIFGAGPDVVPLASIANQVDFSVHVWDWRPTFMNDKHYPNVKLFSQPDVGVFIKDVGLNYNDSVIIMTHDFQKDQEILSYRDHFKSLTYIGILGPRKRTKRLLQKDSIPSYLHSPVGKDIGAEGPAEIAISILSDLIDAHKSKSKLKKQPQINRTSS